MESSYCRPMLMTTMRVAANTSRTVTDGETCGSKGRSQGMHAFARIGTRRKGAGIKFREPNANTPVSSSQHGKQKNARVPREESPPIVIALPLPEPVTPVCCQWRPVHGGPVVEAGGMPESLVAGVGPSAEVQETCEKLSSPDLS